MAVDFGTDMAIVDGDVTAEGRIVSGFELVAQALTKRWQTPRGMLLDDENYGTDLSENINDDLDGRSLARIGAEARGEAMKDERVKACTIADLHFDTDRKRITFTAKIETYQGPFRMVVSVDQVTVSLLSVE